MYGRPNHVSFQALEGLGDKQIDRGKGIYFRMPSKNKHYAGRWVGGGGGVGAKDAVRRGDGAVRLGAEVKRYKGRGSWG